MVEKLLLAVTVTFSLTLLAGTPTQSSAPSVFTANSTDAPEVGAQSSVRSLLISKLIEPRHP